MNVSIFVPQRPLLLVVTFALLCSGASLGDVNAQGPEKELGENEGYGKSLLRAVFANMRSLESFDVSLVRERVERNRDNVLVEKVTRARQVIDRGSGRFFFASLLESRAFEEKAEKTPSQPVLQAVHIDANKQEFWQRLSGRPPQRVAVRLKSPGDSFELAALSGSYEPDLRCIGFSTFPTRFYSSSDYAHMIERFLSYPKDRWSSTPVGSEFVDVVIDRPMEAEGYGTRFWYRFDTEKLVPIEVRTFEGSRGEYTPAVFEQISWDSYNGQMLPVRVVGEERTGEALPNTYQVDLEWHVVNDKERLPDLSASTLVDAKALVDLVNRSDDAKEGAAGK